MRSGGRSDEADERNFERSPQNLSTVHRVVRRLEARWRRSDARDRVYVPPFNAHCSVRDRPVVAESGAPGVARFGISLGVHATVRSSSPPATFTVIPP